MCISMGPAEFFGTILYCGRKIHPQHGRIEVMGYQNTAVNLAGGPNAMLLHLPAKSMSSHQFLQVGRSDRVLRDMVDAVKPIAVGRSLGPTDWMGEDTDSLVEVFQHDIYTVVLAANAAHIPAALAEVEPRKRPPLNAALFEFYAEFFPDYPVALCCFDNADAAEAKPLLLWYEPLNPEQLVLPAIDCHTGGAPDLTADVLTDHWVILGTDDAPRGWGTHVDYGEKPKRKLLEFLPSQVIGWHFGETMPNGDFAIDYASLLAGDVSRIERLRPERAR